MVGGGDASLEQVKAVVAWHCKTYAKEQSAADRSAYAAAEVASRARYLGLWADRDPTPPWD